MENENGDIQCCLIFGKSRVALVKYVSIPRLELTAATLSVKISMMLKEKLDIHITSESFWTDSQIVLGYIDNESWRLKLPSLIVCNLSATTLMFNNDNMYQHMTILLMMHAMGLTLRTWVKHKDGLMYQLSFGLQKKLGCVISSQSNR